MRILIIILICFISNYCIGQRAFTLEELKYYIPKKSVKYNLANETFKLADTSIINQNAVYVSILEEELREDYMVISIVRSYTYMRFFNDGKVYVSFPYKSYPTIEEINDRTYGKYGRYVIKDGELKVELYMDKQDGVMYMFAKSVVDGLQFYKSTGTGIGQKMKVNKTNDGGFYKKSDCFKCNNF